MARIHLDVKTRDLRSNALRYWHGSMIYTLTFHTQRILPPNPRMICISFQLSNFFFCHIKSRTPSVDKLRMTFNSTVTYITLSDNNAGMVYVASGVS